MHKTLFGIEFSPVGVAAGLLRVGLGMLFFFAGLGKVLGEGGAAGFASWLVSDFESTWLPGFLVSPFAYALPYIEVAVGALLILGLRTFEALSICGLLLIALAFGKVLKQDHGTVANNLNYVLVAAAALWAASIDNRYSIDAVLGRRRSASKE